MDSVLSVVIPVYNSEQYIDSCIKSVQNQTFKNLDIILVDNNSTDKSVEKCKTFRKQDPRIVYGHQSAPGAAATRNMGIDKAVGDYITFVDSDDYLDARAYELMMNRMIQENSEAVICSYHYVDEKGKTIGWYEPRLKRYMVQGAISGKDACKIFLTSRDIEGFGWNKIFKIDLLKQCGLRFEENKTAFEDMALVFRLLSKCKRVSFIDQKLYNYRQHEASLVHQKYNIERVNEYEDTMKAILDCAMELGLEKEAKSSMIYRNILSEYAHGYNRDFDIKVLIYEALSVLKYQRTEKIKTFLKLLILYLRKK